MNNAVQAAVACNALGILVCDWSLPGQVNPATVSIPALLAGAGLAWKAETDLVSEFAVRRREQNMRKPTYLAYWQALVGSGKFCARNLGTTGVCLSLHFTRKVIQHAVGITMQSKINRKNRPTDIVLQPCLSFKFMFASLQMTLRSSLPDVLSQHVFMDTSGTFGRALMDLGRTHSTILKDETDESCDVIANNRVQPVARGPGGTLLWQILALKGSSGVAALSSESLQVYFLNAFLISNSWNVILLPVPVMSERTEGGEERHLHYACVAMFFLLLLFLESFAPNKTVSQGVYCSTTELQTECPHFEGARPVDGDLTFCDQVND